MEFLTSQPCRPALAESSRAACPIPSCPFLASPQGCFDSGSTLIFLVFHLVAMGKPVKKPTKKDVEKKLAKLNMPFQEARLTKQPRNMKDRQHLHVLAGLKHLGAPLVSGQRSTTVALFWEWV